MRFEIRELIADLVHHECVVSDGFSNEISPLCKAFGKLQPNRKVIALVQLHWQLGH